MNYDNTKPSTQTNHHDAPKDDKKKDPQGDENKKDGSNLGGTKAEPQKI